MARDFIVKGWQPWIDRETEDPIRDQHGNYKGSVTFENSEPVDATFKQPPAVGDKKYGDIETYTTKSGATRKKFKSAQRPQEGFTGGSGKSNYQPRDDAAVKAQFAIKAAIAFCPKPESARDMNAIAAIEDVAKQFYQMVDRVKNSGSVAQVFNDGEPLPEYQGD